MKAFVLQLLQGFLLGNNGSTNTHHHQASTALFVSTTGGSYDPVLDWNPPSPDAIRQTRTDILDRMKSLTSAAFYSTDENGRRHEGLSRIPSLPPDRPLLFVSNHQLLGFDSWLVVNELEAQCNIFPRSLTHPFLYPSNQPDGTSFLEKNGCLPVSTRNFYRLLQTNQPILLFPGGAKESFMNTLDDAYRLKGWTNDGKTDFVRAAAKFNATIVPFSSVGAAESAFFWDDLPLLNDLSRPLQAILQSAAGVRAPINARYDQKGQSIPFPLVVPKPLPVRHYFLFHPAVELLDNVSHNDRQACETVYKGIKQTIQNGCLDLVQASTQDPFNDPLRRLPYEQFWRKQAPSFDVKVLNT